IIVDAVAGLAQYRVVGRDLEDRAENDLGLDPVAIHILEPQFGYRRPPFALVVKPAPVEGVVDRLYGPLIAGGGRLAAPGAPCLAVADPHGLTVALLDMRSAVAQRGRKSLGPQIRRQLAEIHVVVAGDQPIGHVSLRSRARDGAKAPS